MSYAHHDTDSSDSPTSARAQTARSLNSIDIDAICVHKRCAASFETQPLFMFSARATKEGGWQHVRPYVASKRRSPSNFLEHVTLLNTIGSLINEAIKIDPWTPRAHQIAILSEHESVCFGLPIASRTPPGNTTHPGGTFSSSVVVSVEVTLLPLRVAYGKQCAQLVDEFSRFKLAAPHGAVDTYKCISTSSRLRNHPSFISKMSKLLSPSFFTVDDAIVPPTTLSFISAYK